LITTGYGANEQNKDNLVMECELYVDTNAIQAKTDSSGADVWPDVPLNIKERSDLIGMYIAYSVAFVPNVAAITVIIGDHHVSQIKDAIERFIPYIPTHLAVNITCEQTLCTDASMVLLKQNKHEHEWSSLFQLSNICAQNLEALINDAVVVSGLSRDHLKQKLVEGHQTTPKLSSSSDNAKMDVFTTILLKLQVEPEDVQVQSLNSETRMTEPMRDNATSSSSSTSPRGQIIRSPTPPLFNASSSATSVEHTTEQENTVTKTRAASLSRS